MSAQPDFLDPLDPLEVNGFPALTGGQLAEDFNLKDSNKVLLPYTFNIVKGCVYSQKNIDVNKHELENPI